ncbi:MAG: methylated-DNA--[protein]-cysteine S-methyltransferase [Actinobacteria bacterium]|nr:methylated-DNA--[protein]-cysteine S-methyltransferase [Actinomycetota bacterium]
MAVTHAVVESPLGELTLVASDRRLSGVYFAGQRNRPRPERLGRPTPEEFAEPGRQLGEYFAGERAAFELELDLHGDEFDQRVWELVASIPYGQTRTYGQLASELGDPGLAQQVGVANARNRLLIVVPCHRVVGANGRLTGYAGGLARKAALLDLEATDEAREGRLF